jgi:hypothetical protein
VIVNESVILPTPAPLLAAIEENLDGHMLMCSDPPEI